MTEQTLIDWEYVRSLAGCAYNQRDLLRWREELLENPFYMNPLHAMLLVEGLAWPERSDG